MFVKVTDCKSAPSGEELKHAEDYINWHYGKVGKTDNLGNPIKEVLPLNLNNIPKKRQEVNIDKILNLK